MQISRLFELVYLLLDRKQMTARELAAHFEVSSRTIYRDVETLAQSGIPIYATKGNKGGIGLTENFVLNKSVLSGEEQKSILASLQGMNALKIDEVRPVLDKLAAFFGTDNEDWVEVDFTSWNPENPVSQRFRLLKDAIFTRRAVSFLYSGVRSATAQRTAEPAKLVFRGYDWYLLGFCRLRGEFRFFKLSRMEALTELEETFVRRPMPPPPSRERQAIEAPAFREISLTVRIVPALSYRVCDEFSPSQREEQPDGGYIVRFHMAGDEWLYQYLMTYGAGLSVIEPDEVRKELAGRYKKAYEANLI